MTKLSLREAVKHFDVSRPTLSKALKTGKISGVQDGKGQWTIDPAELIRRYRSRSSEPVSDEQFFTTQNSAVSDELITLRYELDAERARANVAEALAEERRQHIEDLRRLIPAARGEATEPGGEDLEPETPVTRTQPAGWFSRLLRRSQRSPSGER
jgi:hypothetical protein